METRRSRRATRLLQTLPAVALAMVTVGCGGNSAPQTATSAAAASVTVTAPANGTVINGERVTVRGTIAPANASVQIQGKPAAAGAGQFAASVGLHPGANTIEVIASAVGEAPATTSLTVTRSSIPTTKPSTQTRTVTVQGQTTPPTGGVAQGDWPSATAAWTVIVASDTSQHEAQAAVQDASRAGLAETGVLLSNEHSSLRPGYWVAFSGVLNHEQALARQTQARSSGFTTAYARYVSAR
jgi:hypothetical protein